MQQHIVHTTGKVLSVKDIHNMKAAVNKEHGDVTTVLEDYTRRNPNTDVRVLVNDDDVVNMIFMQTESMKECFSKFPEVLLLDGTYSINNCGMPLYAFLAEDGNGHGQIVGLFLLARENAVDIKSMVEIFASANPTVADTKTVVVDKDFSEIAALQTVLPHVALQLCTFHCIKAVKAKLSTLAISTDEKRDLLAIFRKLLYAKDEAEFQGLTEQIHTKSQVFLDYLAQNWFPIKERWVHYMKNCHLNLGNTTTNRIESQFGKLKQLLQSKVSLALCLRQLLQFADSIRGSMSFSTFTMQNKTSYNTKLSSDEGRFFGLCTRYACDRIVRSIEKAQREHYTVTHNTSSDGTHSVHNSRKNLTYTVDNLSSCSCLYYSSCLLPCKHVFAVRK